VAIAERHDFCLYLRTKNGYFRSPDGERLIDPESSTACYACLLTQRPAGPDGQPCSASECRPGRGCFRYES
jgi:hypothetical protein